MKVWALHNVIAEVRDGNVKIVIDEPITLLDIKEYRKKSNKKLKDNVRKLKRLLEKQENGVVRLAGESHLIRLGGGLVQVEGARPRRLILIRRDEKAPRMPLTFDIPAGVFDEHWSNPLEMMIGESVEILRLDEENTLYYPSIGIYEDTVLDEIEKIVAALRKSGVDIGGMKKIDAKLFPITPNVEVVYKVGEISKISGVAIAFEYGDPSIELVGAIEIRADREFKYSDGELLPGLRLLDREIHSVNLQTLDDTVWRSFRAIRKSNFKKELDNSKGLTPKAAHALISLNVIGKEGIEAVCGASSWDLL